MWNALLEKEEKNFIVISNKIDITKFIDRALFQDQGRYTIILDKFRPSQNNMKLNDLQIINKIDDAVAYRNSEDANVVGWVLFVGKEDGMLASLRSVAQIIEDPHQRLLEHKMNEVGLSHRHVKQLSELISKEPLNEERFWTSLQSQDRSEFIRAMGLIYSVTDDLKKYNYDYREIISQHLDDPSSLNETIKELLQPEAVLYRQFIERLDQNVIKDYNFEEELSRELREPDVQSLLGSIDLPYKAPVKLSVKVRFSGKNYTRVNSKVFFYASSDTSIKIGIENTDGYLITNNDLKTRSHCRAGETVNIAADKAILNVKITGLVDSAESITYTFYSVQAETEGVYIQNSSKLIHLTKLSTECTLKSFNQSTVGYLVHRIDDTPKCEVAQIEKLFSSNGFCLSRISAFNSEESTVSILLNDIKYTLSGFDLNEAETVVLNDGIGKKRLSALDYGNKVFSVSNSNEINELERRFLTTSGLSILTSYNSVDFTCEDNSIFCSKLDKFDIKENSCDLTSTELLDCWNEIKLKLQSSDYKPSALFDLSRTLGFRLIKRFYDLYNTSLETDFIQTSRFLTISIIEDAKIQSILLPFFHPVVLMDIFTYFENYEIEDRISLNAHHSASFLKSIWINNETYIALENTGFIQPVFIHERCNLSRIISKFNLTTDANTLLRCKQVNDDQILRSFDAMFDYHGFSRIFHVRLLINDEIEIRRFISLILSNKTFRDRLNRSTLYIHLSEFLFDGLSKYYTQGHEFIKLARAESTVEYNLLIDARKNDDIKYGIKPVVSEINSNFLSIGFPLFPYEDYDSNNIRITYSEQFSAHKKLASPSNQDLVVTIRSRDQEIDDYQRAKIISLQIDRFNLLASSLSHLVYEMRSVNRLRYSSYQKSNFIIAISGTKQLRARLAHGLAEYEIAEHLDVIEKGLLQENLFSFSHMFGNRNKLKGIVGELMTFRTLDQLCLDRRTAYLIPVDPIIAELKLYLRSSSHNNWTQYPDFILLEFQEDCCDFHFIEVKSRLECDYQNVLNEQLRPIQAAMSEWLDDFGQSELERKRFVTFLIEYVMRVMLDKMPTLRLESVYKWIACTGAKIELRSPILVHLDDTEESKIENVDECIVIRHSFKSSLSEYLKMSGDNELTKKFDKIFNSGYIELVQKVIVTEQQHLKGIIERPTNEGLTIVSSQIEYTQMDDQVKNEEMSKSHASSVSTELETTSMHDDLLTFDFRKGREDLYFELDIAYKDVKRRLGREGLYLDESDYGVKLSPMNIRFTYAITEGTSIKSIKSKSSDIALWLRLPQGQSVEIDSDMGNVVMEYPLPATSRMFFEYSEICGTNTNGDELTVPIGVDEDGKVVEFQFGSDSPHLLIGGTTGSGKSVALETIVGGLLSRYNNTQLNVVIVDPKQTELVDFEVARAVRENCLNAEIGYNAEHAIEILINAVAEMERRNALFASMSKELRSKSKITRSLKNITEYNQNTLGENLPRILIVLDEYADLVSNANRKKELQSNLVKIAQKGRSTGIHLIVATQKPVVEVIDTVIKSNLPASLALRVSKMNDSMVIMDEGGAERLLGKGDAYLKIGSLKIRLQIARFGEDQFAMLS